MTKTSAMKILTATERTKRNIVLSRQKAYFKPFFSVNKEWAQLSAECAADFSLALDKLIKDYQSKCIKLISGKKIFRDKTDVRKAKKYKTNEYLDEFHNSVIVDDVRDALVELKDIFTKGLKDNYEKYITKGHIRESAELVYKDFGIAFNFNKFNAAASEYLKEKSINWSKAVAEETERFIKEQLVKGYEKGLSTYDIAENIRRVSGFSFSRSESIAQTEVMAARNYAKHIGQMDDPNVIGSEWSAVIDERTRPTHSAANGQKRKKGEPFDVGGYKMMFPGDSSQGAPAKEVIGCRCSLVDVLKGEELDSNTAYDEKDAGTKEWFDRRPEAFKEEYAGGKTKKELINVGLMDIKDRELPLNEILERIYPVKVTSAEVMKVSELPEATVNEVIKRANELWLFGKLNNKEANVTLRADTGKKACKNVIGVYGGIPKTSENYNEWIRYLDKAKENSSILNHNHNNISPISLDDLLFFLKRKSIKSMFIVDDAGNFYFIEKTANAVYNTNIKQMKAEIEYRLASNYEIIKNDKRWFKYTKEKQRLIRNNFFILILKKYLHEEGVKFEKW